MRKICQCLVISLLPTIAHAQNAPECRLKDENGERVQHEDWEIISNAVLDPFNNTFSDFALYISVNSRTLSIEVNGESINVDGGRLVYNISPTQQLSYFTPYLAELVRTDAGIRTDDFNRSSKDGELRRNNPLNISFSLVGADELSGSNFQERRIGLPLDILDAMGSSSGVVVTAESDSGVVSFLESIDLQGFTNAVNRAIELHEPRINAMVQAGSCQDGAAIYTYDPE